MTTGPSSSLPFVSSWIPELVLFLSSLPTAWQPQHCCRVGSGLGYTQKEGEFKCGFRRHGFALDSFIQKEDVFAGSEGKEILLKQCGYDLNFSSGKKSENQ